MKWDNNCTVVARRKKKKAIQNQSRGGKPGEQKGRKKIEKTR